MMSSAIPLIAPHGRDLVNLMVDPDRRKIIEAASRDCPSLDLAPQQISDLELLINGGFSPLRGFMGRGDYEAVCQSMHLRNGILWPVPITLDVFSQAATKLRPGVSLAMRDSEGRMLALMCVDEVWQPDRMAEAQLVYGTTDTRHPAVSYLLEKRHPFYVSGHLEG